MGILFTNDRHFATAANNIQLSGQSQASIAFFLRYETDGPMPPGTNTSLVLRGDTKALYGVWGAVGSNAQANLTMWNDANQASTVRPVLTPGVSYHVALVWAQGQQTAYTNGLPSSFGTKTGTLKTSNTTTIIGQNNPGRAAKFTIDDFAIWNGYALTADDVAALRDGTLKPDQIGAAASTRWYYTLDGTVGAVPAIGDPGLNDAHGTGLNFKTVSGGGSAVYVDQLAVIPTVDIGTAYVASSGKSIVAFFKLSEGGSEVIPTQLIKPPTIFKNGENMGTAPMVWCDGMHKHLIMTIPAGVSFEPGDACALTAPTAWVNSNAGIVHRLDNHIIENRVRTTGIGVESLKKTFRPGMGFCHHGTPAWSTYAFQKNWTKRFNAPFPGTSAPDGKPITLTASPAVADLITMQNTAGGNNQIDQTQYPGQTGLYAIGWDAPVTSFALTTGGPTTVITERTDLANPGVSGVGRVRVFDVQRQLASTSAAIYVRLQITDPSLKPEFNNLRVYGPDDFTWTENMPTVLEADDPYALSNRTLDRFKNSIGCARYVDSCFQFGGVTNAAEPWHLRNITDFAWGEWIRPSANTTIVFNQARPWSHANSPYVYSEFFGSPFDATLASSIDAVTSSLSISDAVTAPVMVGLLLKADDELMKVRSVSGTNVVVERGVNGTTAATHAAGTIQVLNRFPVNSLDDWKTPRISQRLCLWELVSSAPHGLKTGQYALFTGTWPSFTFTNGGSLKSLLNLDRTVIVTGPNTFVSFTDVGSGTGIGNLTAPVTLNGANMLWRIPEGAGLPVELSANATGQFSGCDYYMTIPQAASDAMVLEIARRVRDQLPADRKVWIEYADEPWNYQKPWYQLQSYLSWISTRLYPGGFGLEFNAIRSAQILDLVRSIWTEGQRDPLQVQLLLNVQFAQPGTASTYLNFCATHDKNGKDVPAGSPESIDLGGICVAPYLSTDRTQVGIDYCDAVDDDQWCDAWLHDFQYNLNTWSFRGNASVVRDLIDTHNTTYSRNVVLFGYEGGCANPMPILLNNTAEAKDRTTRGRDIIYNPNWYFCELAFFAALQEFGFTHMCIAFYSMNYVGADAHNVYRWQGQPYGYGDGSDGKADNRLCLARPGQPHTKDPTTNQDLQNVSVRGQALIDWMASFTIPEPGPEPTPEEAPQIVAVHADPLAYSLRSHQGLWNFAQEVWELLPKSDKPSSDNLRNLVRTHESGTGAWGNEQCAYVPDAALVNIPAVWADIWFLNAGGQVTGKPEDLMTIQQIPVKVVP